MLEKWAQTPNTQSHAMLQTLLSYNEMRQINQAFTNSVADWIMNILTEIQKKYLYAFIEWNFMLRFQVSLNWIITGSSYGLTHWGRATHICVGKLTIIGSDNGLSPERRQAIIWTNAGILLIGPLGTNFNEILISIQTFSFKKMHLKVSSAKWRPCCLGLNVLTAVWCQTITPKTLRTYCQLDPW